MPYEVLDLTPEQIASATPVPDAPPVTQDIPINPPSAAAPSGGMDILRDMSVDQMVELAKQPESGFDLAEIFRNDAAAQKDPALLAKAAEAYKQIRLQPWYEGIPVVSGIAHGDLGEVASGAAKAASTVGSALAGGAQWIGNVAGVVAGEAATGAGKLMGLSPEVIAENQRETQRKAVETIASTELGTEGVLHAATATAKAIGRGLHLTQQIKDQTAQDAQAEFQAAVFRKQLEHEATIGEGPIMRTVGPDVVKDLAAHGQAVRPEEVAKMAGGDPFSFMLFGKGLSGVTGLAKAGVAASGFGGELAAAGSKIASVIPSAEMVAGKTVQRAGNLAQGAAKVAEVTAPYAGASVGATVAAKIPVIGEAPFGLGHVAGAVEGWRAGKALATSLHKLGQNAAKITEFGKQIAGEAPLVSSYAVAARNLASAAADTASATAHGALFDIGLAAAMDTPAERESVGMGATLGLLGGVAKGFKTTVSGQLISPRSFQGSEFYRPGSGIYPGAETMSKAAFDTLTPGQRVRLNASREFATGINPNADIFVGADPAAIKKTLVSDFKIDEPTADLWASQNAMTFDHNGRKVVILSAKGIDSAPHEARHAIENVIGEEKLRDLDTEIQSKYNIDQLGREYTARMYGMDPGANWKDALLEGSGWGNVNAVEKMIQEATAKYNDEARKAGTTPPTDAEIRTIVEKSWEDLGVQRNWRDTLTPEEASDVANRFMSREIAAENFDSWFKSTGGKGEPNKQMPDVLARFIGRTMEVFGQNPLAGKVSEELGVPLQPGVIREIVKQGAEAKPAEKAPVIEPVGVKPGPRGLPKTPEEVAAAAKEAAEAAKSAPDVPLPGANMSQREVLGTMSEAIAQGSGVRLNYLSAPDEPAAAISAKRDVRREMIETYRNMPESARKLFEKIFFPNMVRRIKNGFQVNGWAPEVLAANAQRFAEVAAKNPALRALSPYEIDPATKSFTEAGWLDLYGDLTTFTRNQKAGFTGSGKPLNVPPKQVAAGMFKPPTKPGEVLALDQTKADFLNMLFGARLPDTARITSGKMPLNIAGQDVSAATIPGRVLPPSSSSPKPSFTGKAAEKLGIEGRPILEVNPLRNQMENALKATGEKMPSFIEAMQNLNVDRILEAQHAPEAPEFRGNTLTIAAGFSPKRGEPIPRERTAEKLRDEAVPRIGGVQTTPAKTPPVEEQKGFVRVYSGSEGVGSSWFTTNPDRARSFGKDTVSVDVPESKFLELQNESRKVGRPASDVVLPNDLVKTATPADLGGTPSFEVDSAQFAVKRKANEQEYKMREGPGMFIKAWIAPDGKPIQLGAQWHHEYINENPEVMKKYGLTKTTSGEENRSQALQKGFARVNYSKNAGTLTVEARAKDWETLMPSVRKFVEANLSKIDNMDVHLLDAKAKRIVNSDGVQLFTYDTPAEKMANLPLISAPNPVTEMSAQAGSLRSENVQFSPGGKPEEIKSAAVRDPESGKIYEGFAHFAARQEAIQDGHALKDVIRFEDGFRTNGGEFLNREQAYQRAVELKQYVPNTVKPSMPDKTKQLESVAFERQQKLKEMGYAPDVQFSPRFEHKGFSDELKKVREAEGFSGQTFNVDGTPWIPSDKRDVVTLASVNVPRAELTPEKVREAVAPYDSLLDHQDVKVGVFGFTDNEGKPLPTVSIDVNATVPQEYRDNSVKFAKANDQVSIWDAHEGAEVKTGGEGNTRLKTVEELNSVLSPLVEGKPVNIDEVIKQSTPAVPVNTEPLGIEGKPIVKFEAGKVNEMTKDERAAHFPESVVPKTLKQVIQSDIKGSPLFKQSKTEAQAVHAFADGLVKFANMVKDIPAFIEGLRWYADIVPQLKAEFGELAPMFTELLAATSPRNTPDQNFKYSAEAVEGFRTGHYDRHVKGFLDGLGMLEGESWKTWWGEQEAAGKVKAVENLTKARFMKQWIKVHDLVPMQSNGKKFGMNSVAVLKVMSRSWLKTVKGPKVNQFVRNLLGTDHGATIDVWANRTMRRIGYENFVKRWRILPKNEAAVSDADFKFGQAAFAEAAKRLGVLPDALQGGLWFAEKKLWADRGYGRLDLGTFANEIKKMPRYREEIAARRAAQEKPAPLVTPRNTVE